MQSSQSIKHSKLFFLLIVILAIILFFYGLGTRPFDGDEGVVILISSSSWSDILTRASLDVHPPFYHTILKLFISGGTNEWSVRVLSALAGIGSVVFTYLFIKKLFNQNPLSQMISLISALFLTISPYLIYPVQEARMYSLFLFLSLGSYYFLLILIKEKSNWYRWIAYIIFSTLLLCTHYLGFIVIFSQIIYLLIFQRKTIKKWWQWILSWIIMGILFLPQLPTMINQFSARISEQSQTLSLGINIQGLIGAIYRFGPGRLFLDLNLATLRSLMSENPLLYIGFLITLFIPLWLLIKGLMIVYKKYKIQFWFLMVPIIIAILLAIFSTEVGSRASRYLIYIFPFYIIFISFGFLHYWKKQWTIIIPILFLVINISGLVYHYNYENRAPGVNKIAEFISNNYQDDNIVLIRGGFGGGEKWALEYYWNMLHVTRYTLHVYDMLGNYSAGNLAQLKAIKPEDQIQKLLKDYNRVFFYDMTYETKNISNSQKYILGQDKEKKDLIVWEVEK